LSKKRKPLGGGRENGKRGLMQGEERPQKKRNVRIREGLQGSSDKKKSVGGGKRGNPRRRLSGS